MASINVLRTQPITPDKTNTSATNTDTWRARSGLSSRALSHSFRTTALLFRRQLWIWPLIAVPLFATMGFWVRAYVEQPLEENLQNGLTTILDSDVAALRLWLGYQQERVELFAADVDIRETTDALAILPAGTPQDVAALLSAPQQATLRQRYEEHHDVELYSGYILFDMDGRVLAADTIELVGKARPMEDSPWLSRAIAGEPVVSIPYKSRVLLRDRHGRERTGVPTILVLAPVMDSAGTQIGVLGIRVRPEGGFTSILRIAEVGESGETYAIDRNGLMLSQSRFDDGLRAIGLLADDGESASILTLAVRDPGVNMIEGERPDTRRSEQPLTFMAQSLTKGESGVDVEGYRDYRGVPVVGAWAWLEEFHFGVATEMDVDQAYLPLYYLRTVFWGLYALLGVAALAIFVFTVIVSRLNREARHAALKERKMGKYALEDELGKGGMGVVYRARHELLRRPTAVKLLDIDRTTPESIARFEREVKLTSQLYHPNTITVFDYGHTPEGVFYYAMELLEGLNLDELVIQNGALPEGRVIHILSQVCSSLAEAHSIGLIHRDIKPANIMVTARAGMYDFVKVLDFGVVKAMDGEIQSNLTAANSWVGTPYYMSPEAIQNPDDVDARSDIYALGAVGYYLLTGTMVFGGNNPAEIMRNHTTKSPEPISERLRKAVSPELEAVIMQCLSKVPGKRPQNTEIIAQRLSACTLIEAWGPDSARAWWQERFPDQHGTFTKSPSIEATDIRTTTEINKVESIDQVTVVMPTGDEEKGA